MSRLPPISTLFPYTTLFRSSAITVPGYGFLLNNELTDFDPVPASPGVPDPNRSEEHTSELQSRLHLVCRLLLEKKKKKQSAIRIPQTTPNLKFTNNQTTTKT